MKSGSLPIAPRVLATGPDMVLSKKPLSVGSRVGKHVREVSGLPAGVNSGSIRLDQVMSKTGADGTEDQEIDPHEQTETRTRAPSVVDDDNWDLGEPVITKVPSIPPPTVTTKPVESSINPESKPASTDLSANTGAMTSADQNATGRTVNPAKFPTAMAELSKSEPKIKSEPKTEAVPDLLKTKESSPRVSGDPPLLGEQSPAIVASPIITVDRASAKSEGKLAVVKDVQSAKSEGKLAVVKDVQSAKSERKFPVAKDVQSAKSEGKLAVVKDVQSAKSEGKLAVVKDVQSAKSEGKLAVVKDVQSAKSEGKLAVVKDAQSAKSESKFPVSPSVDSHDEKRPSNANIKAPRERQESFLSLESDHVVEFFSSPPAALSDSGYAEDEPEMELMPPPRSLFPAAELKERRRHFRALVVKVMLVAIALFAFSMYVFWRRGLFDRVGF
jgi:hypothetical protein